MNAASANRERVDLREVSSPRPRALPGARWLLEHRLLLGLLAAAAVLRLIGLSAFPEVQADEGLWTNSPKNFIAFGDWFLDGRTHLFLSPLFSALAALSFWLTGPSIAAARRISAVAGVASVGLLYATAVRAGAGPPHPSNAMDNLTHTLAGAILAEAGLGRRTRLGTATLLIGANLPDVDALAYLRDPLVALTLRRGWTHGILAMVVLPVLLAGAMVASGRWRTPTDAGRVGATAASTAADPPLRPREILLLAAIAVWSHPLLDLLNNYGVRLLMPFSGRWFYGDAIFIIDPWLLLILCAGTLLAAGRRSAGRTDAERPARIAGAVALGYIAVMIGSGVAARRITAREAAASGVRFTRAMVAPVPVTPFRRSVIVDLGDGYRRGTFDWRTSPHLTLAPNTVPQRFTTPPVAAALASAPARAFLTWSRFPAAAVDSGAAPPLVRLYDLRYARPDAPSWAAVELEAEAAR